MPGQGWVPVSASWDELRGHCAVGEGSLVGEGLFIRVL